MARRKRVKRRQRRRSGRRWLTRLAIGAALAVPVLYFAFTKLLYDPYEDAQPPFPVLVPRDVDLFVRREALHADMEVFPRPVLLDRLMRSREYRELAGTTWWQGLAWPGELEAALAEGEAATEGLPLDPLADVLGSEVALVGRLPEDGPPELLLMARISGRTKLAVEALDFGVVRSRALPGATLEREEDPDVPGLTWRRLAVPGEGDVFYARRLDLLAASRSRTLLRDVLRAVQGSREASLGLSRLYIDRLPPPSTAPDERLTVDLAVEAQPLLRLAGLGDTTGAGAAVAPDKDAAVAAGAGAAAAAGPVVLPEPGPDAVMNALEKLVDLSLLREVVARVELDERLAVRLYADVDHALASQRHTGLVGAPGFRVQERLRDALAMLPADTSGAIVLNVELRPFLQTISAAINPDMVRLLDDLLKDVVRYNPGWPVDDLGKLIDYLDRTLDGRLTLAVRPLDHAVPEGSQPLPLIALIAPIKDAGRWRQLDQAVVRGHKALGLDRERMWQQDEGVGLRKWLGLPLGLPVEEVAYILLDDATAVVGTDDAFVHEIVAAYANNRDTLHARAEVRDAVARFGDARGNVAGWGDTRALLRLILPYADYVADLDTVLDLGVLRLQRRRELLQGPFREWSGREDEMPPEESEALDAQLDAHIAGLEAERQAQQMPTVARAFRERQQWLTMLGGFAFSLRIGERDAEMSLYADTVLAGR